MKNLLIWGTGNIATDTSRRMHLWKKQRERL